MRPGAKGRGARVSRALAVAQDVTGALLFAGVLLVMCWLAGLAQ